MAVSEVGERGGVSNAAGAKQAVGAASQVMPMAAAMAAAAGEAEKARAIPWRACGRQRRCWGCGSAAGAMEAARPAA